MTSSSSSMNLQKPLKVKSRWYQSTQMEMMMEESQSSLDMSDTITDVSTSDMNESADYSSKLKSVKLRRSRRTGNIRTDYRKLNGSKSTLQKTPLASKTSTKKGRKKKLPLNTSDIKKKDKLKTNISEDFNIIFSFIDWNNITVFQSKRRSKSVSSVNEFEDRLPQKSVRRSSLSWEFRFTPENEVDLIENEINILNKSKHYNNSYESKHLSTNETVMNVSSNNDCTNGQFYEDVQGTNIRSASNENIPQKLHDVENYSLSAFSNDDSSVEFGQMSITNFNELKKSTEMNKLAQLYNVKNNYQPNHVVHFSSELKNLVCYPVYKPKNMRSKSCDSLQTSNSIINKAFRRCKSSDDVGKLGNSAVEFSKLQILQKKSFKKNRRQSKRIKPKNNCIEIIDDIKVPEVNYDQVADEMYIEHKNQLLQTRNNDKEFDDKLKYTNFTLINENVYRPNRQTLKLYPTEMMSALRNLKQRVISGDINDYCECTLSKEDIIKGKTGCGDRCLNRLLKVECGSGCSLKRYCTNKQFQNKQFKKTNIINTEKKGYGISAVEDIPKGVLISEYVGEVIDYNEMCNRLTKKEYKNLNYMVQLNSDEIIDSTSKGNVTRFINHSCDPNAIGEKWCVMGQSRIGFFSTRDIKKGEEITFDYSFQIFGNDPQICYCGSLKCRGYISKAPQTMDFSSSEDSYDSENLNESKHEEKQRRRIILKKGTAFNHKNKLRELSRQLTEIAKLKTGNKADQEMATLNLNRLMVHTTDSVSRLHVLKFIRVEDLNKRLFMDFSGLSIFHNWMTSNENDSFKLMILEILAELPITNRNTITKSKVLDVVAEWAVIPQDVKATIESLEYPTSNLEKDRQDINNIFPSNNKDNETTINDLIIKSRDLWKKWIALKMLFRIPKKIDNHKACKEMVNSNEVIEDSYNYPNPPMDITTLDQRTYKISKKYYKKVQNQQIISPDRIKLRKEYEFKVEQERQKLFRKKVMDDWHDKMEGVMKKKSNNNCLQHQQSLNLPSHDNILLNHNIEFIKPTRWDCSSQVPQLRQNSMVNYSVQNTHLNVMPSLPQSFNQYSQYSYMLPQTPSECHPVEQPTNLINYIQPPPNHPYTTQLQHYNNNALLNPSQHQISEPPIISPTNRLVKTAETNVFKLINDCLLKHSGSDKKTNSETEYSNKLCSKTVQSGVDLLARMKTISNSFKNQPSKLIKIHKLKQNDGGKAKLKTVSSSDVILKSFCDKNKKITFINDQTGVTSNALSEDLVPTPKTVSLSEKNPFAKAILLPLLKKAKLEKENLTLKKFVLPNLNYDLVTCFEPDKEINLYKNMKPKKIKKVVSHLNTKNGRVSVIKKYWGIKHKDLQGKHDKIPATKRNIMRKGNIHKLALKNGHVILRKSALKNKNSNITNDCSKKPKEKRVTFKIDGEPSPIFPYSEIRPIINLNQNTKEKPLMKCHPFEIRNEPKSILQMPTSVVQNDGLFPLEQPSETNSERVILPIVKRFKASRNRRASLRDKTSDLEQLRSQRKNMIPESMMSLSVDVLKLIPDNKKDMKKVIDYYHSMATIIVKILGSYAKKTCQQGRIRSDEDFKFLAKKINENVLLKELQIKKADKMKITNNTKSKVAEYIKKYMSRFGEVYKRKPYDQTNHQKSK